MGCGCHRVRVTCESPSSLCLLPRLCTDGFHSPRRRCFLSMRCWPLKAPFFKLGAVAYIEAISLVLMSI